jgi:hypothetical protein
VSAATRLLGGVVSALALLQLASAATAAVPGPEKIARAIAQANAVSGRGAPLLLDVRLRIDGGEPSAEGELAVHPSGLARLELRNRWGFVERHLLQSNDYKASRDGEMLTDPHPFLPPIFLLQAASGEALSAALASFGVAEQQVVLGRLGSHDCYVFGGRLIGGTPEQERLLPSLWVDMVSYDPVRIVRADGVEFRLGPIRVYDRIRVPSWIDILTPRGLRARLEISGVSPADAPAALFQPHWLTTPANASPE